MGTLEYHIPTELSEDRELVTKIFVSHDITINEDPVACYLPKPSTKPAIVGNVDDFKSLYLGPDSPIKLEDYLYTDRSIAGLRVVSFHDATVVVLSWLHAAFDITAKRALLEAWILMMEGREDEIPTPYSHQEDPLSELGKYVLEEPKLGDRRLSTFAMVGWGLSNIPDYFQRQETRVVCLPAGFVEELRATALEQLTATGDDGGNQLLSENDVLAAWLARLAVIHYAPDSDRTVSYSLWGGVWASIIHDRNRSHRREIYPKLGHDTKMTEYRSPSRVHSLDAMPSRSRFSLLTRHTFQTVLSCPRPCYQQKIFCASL